MLWLDSASEIVTDAAVAVAVAAAVFHGRVMSVEEQGLSPEALAVNLWAATAAVISAGYNCGIKTPPWSTLLWLLTA